jgi:hypothetical protein
MALNDCRFLPHFTGLGLMLAAAGCQAGDKSPRAADVPEAPAGKVLESELRAYCPNVILREGTAFFAAYAKGGQDDPTKLMYQASITDVTRSCSRSNGQLTLNIGVAGKVVPGPAAKPGAISMPIRIVVLRGEEILYSNLFKHEATVGAAASQWLFNEPNVSFPDPPEQNIRVFAGFDEGPTKEKAK